MRKLLQVLLIVLGLFIVVGGGFLAWAETPPKPLPDAFAALQSDAQVTVDTGTWLVFTPAVSQPSTGFIIYPGGHVDYRSYAPQARAIAAQGNLVVIVQEPLNLAVFDPNIASEVIAKYPTIKKWAVGGHSLGGAMAASYAYTHPGSILGLVLWASYPASSNDLSLSELKVLSISGTMDGLSTPAKIESSRALLPADTTWVTIQGGNHAQFGWYGPQAGDNPAAISREEQNAQVVQATADFLSTLK